ncbi:MAG TPA: hypothetical protein DIV79_02315 [Opitutae bacterium]|nr:hypothetical protein [Opitutaceae bacterium]HCR28837.1 hypothetical protein [Opitutae bacterium]
MYDKEPFIRYSILWRKGDASPMTVHSMIGNYDSSLGGSLCSILLAWGSLMPFLANRSIVKANRFLPFYQAAID